MTEWQLFYERDPWGPERSDAHAAQVTSAIYNVNRGKGRQPVKVSDCMLKWGPRKPQTPEQQVALVQRMVAAFKAANKRR